MIAIIYNGLVTNAILATIDEAQAAYPNATCIETNNAGIGWAWDGESFTPPPPPAPTVPSAITMRQARLALLGAGLLTSVDTAINSLPEPRKSAAKITWEYSTEVQRHNGLVSQLGPALGLSDAQIDAMFIQGAAL